jgi:3-oxoacyl-[acyl-carrier protein] reductase
MDLGFEGRTAVVTGGSGAIGGAIAIRLAHEGAAVVIGYHTAHEAASRIVTGIIETGGKAHAQSVDVRDSRSVDRFFEAATEVAGPADCLINVAGIAAFSPTVKLPTGTWDDVFATNLRGAFLCSKAALPYMIDAGRGDIVNVSSIAGDIGSFEGAAYAASKAGLDQLTKSMALELGSAGIRVNGVAPGRIDTPFRRQKSGPYFDFMIGQTPLRRLGTVEEIANAVAFLASRACSFITGETLTVSGGLGSVHLQHVEPDVDSRLGR